MPYPWLLAVFLLVSALLPRLVIAFCALFALYTSARRKERVAMKVIEMLRCPLLDRQRVRR